MTQNGSKIINYLLIIVLILMICGNCCYSSFNTVIREGLTGPTDIENDLLLGVGANYKLVTYVGTTWVAVTQPAGLIQDSLLAITMGPDGKLYAISSDFHIMVNNAGGWQKPKQPTGTQWISIATENNQLIGIGQDWKIYVYNITSGTVTPLPPLGTPGTGPVISVLNYDGTDFAVQKDHKLYKWINDKWALYDGSPGPGGDGGLINICEYNGAMWGVGTDKKLYSYSGIPGKWGVPAGNEGIQLLSIYGMSHDNYVKFGFL
jgi:hypothetical protein